MNLFISTATDKVYLALFENNNILKEIIHQGNNDHTTSFYPLLDDLKFKFEDINGIYIVNGPGSYTGLRVGVIYAKMLGIEKHIDLYPIHLLEALGRKDLQEDKRFSSNANRMKNLQELVEILNKEMIKKNSKEWLTIFDQKGLPCGPINTIEEMFADSHTKHREMIIEVKNTKAGTFKSIGMPIKFSKSKTDKSKGAPIFGEHTIEVLIDYGFNKAEIDNLIKNKIIYSSSK